MSTPSTLEGHALVNQSYADAATIMFSAYWVDKDSQQDQKTLLTKIINEKASDKEKAFSLMVGCCRTGKVSADFLKQMMTGMNGSDQKLKLPLLIEAWMIIEPSKADALDMMEALKAEHVSLLPVIVRNMTAWKSADMREVLIRYAFTEDLWIAMAEIQKQKELKPEEKLKTDSDTTVDKADTTIPFPGAASNNGHKINAVNAVS